MYRPAEREEPCRDDAIDGQEVLIGRTKYKLKALQGVVRARRAFCFKGHRILFLVDEDTDHEVEGTAF